MPAKPKFVERIEYLVRKAQPHKEALDVIEREIKALHESADAIYCENELRDLWVAYCHLNAHLDLPEDGGFNYAADIGFLDCGGYLIVQDVYTFKTAVDAAALKLQKDTKAGIPEDGN